MPAERRILLIQCGPKVDEQFYTYPDYDLDEGLVQRGSVMPIATATIAALTPPPYTVDIWDENMRGPATPERVGKDPGYYEIVGVSLMFSYLTSRAQELASSWRSQCGLLAIGGPGLSTSPELFQTFFDVLFINEAEQTWPAFLLDHQQGKVKQEYRQIEKPNMHNTPMPKWDSIASDVPKYFWGAVQTRRGCPFDCEFCDVIYLFGRTPRHKKIEQIVEELRTVERLGAKKVFFTDDEFVGDVKFTKQLLRAVIPVNNSFRNPLFFHTQLTMNVSRDPEVLALLADANFYSTLMGVESFDKETLRETKKFQNIRPDIVGDLRKVSAHGIVLIGMFIVGFDHDTIDSFELTYKSIQEACVPVLGLHMLDAPTGTQLWSRLRADNRLVQLRTSGQFPMALQLRIQPAGMTRVQLIEGYRDLLTRLYDWKDIGRRARSWVDLVTRLPQVKEKLLTKDGWLVARKGFVEKFAVSAEDQKELDGMMEHAFDRGPTLVNRVLYIMFRNLFFKARYRMSRFDELLEVERAAARTGDYIHDKTPLVIPQKFADTVGSIFPDIYSRLFMNLPDKAMIPLVAATVIRDFVVRWGETFVELQEHHREFFRELCDRACATATGQAPETFIPSTRVEHVPLDEVKRSRLAEAVLKDVRDQLVLLSGAG